MNAQGFKDWKNSQNLARWRWRWHLQGGSGFWVAHDLIDMRDEEQLIQWRVMEVEVRRLRRVRTNVVHISTAKARRFLRQAG